MNALRLLSGSGNISLQIPNNQALIGFRIATQGFRIDVAGAGLVPVLLNAQDVLLGL